MRFGAFLRRKREESGISMGDLARYLNVSVPYVSDVERGKKAPFAPSHVKKAAELIGIDEGRLLKVAVKTKGVFKLEVKNGSIEEIAAGAALARGWGNLNDEDFRKLRKFLESSLDN